MVDIEQQQNTPLLVERFGVVVNFRRSSGFFGFDLCLIYVPNFYTKKKPPP